MADNKTRTMAKAHNKDRSSGLLQILEGDLDDLRQIITCRVCINPLYEPYTLSCGHTFCYGCLCQWFARDRMKKTCPDCRTAVNAQPAPAYLVRLLPPYISHVQKAIDVLSITNRGTEVIAGLGVRAVSKKPVLGCEPYKIAGLGV